MPKAYFSLEQKVAQLFMVGSDSINLFDDIEPFYKTGLGGILLFRHHLQPYSSAADVQAMLSEHRQQFGGSALSFIGIDQEGGQVERLPHWLFPTGVLPITLCMQPNTELCRRINQEVSARLRWLGINVNFTPTLDLNRERLNPIIGVRSYGNKASEVIKFGKVVVEEHLRAGVLPVLKHFPGHGSGTEDSHHSLPYFEAWQEDELAPFKALLHSGPPGVMIAHGLYPQLCKQLHADPEIPSSLSPQIVGDLLRGRLGFEGLVFTDDLTMGAVWHDRDPVEVAIMAFEAGVDMLVYRRGQPEAFAAYEAILKRLHQGKLSETRLDESLSRIFSAKAALENSPIRPYSSDDFSTTRVHSIAQLWAEEAQVELKHQFMSPLPLCGKRWLLIAPDRNTMIHYAPDAMKSNDIEAYCREYEIPPIAAYFYSADRNASRTVIQEIFELNDIETIVFIGFNSHLDLFQQSLYRQILQHWPQSKIILASCGMPLDNEVLEAPWIHLQMASYRPAAMEALASWLAHPPQLKK